MKQNGRRKGSGPQTVSLPEGDTPPFNQTNGNGKNISEISFCPGPLPDVQSSFLKSIRQRKNLSQRNFARKLGIQRTRLVRLENRSSEAMTLRELKLLAGVLGCEASELIRRMNPNGKETPLGRSSLSQPLFLFNLEEGIQVGSFLKEPDLFMGTLTLAPRKSLGHGQVPSGDLLFFLVWEGQLLLNLSGKEYLFKAGDCFTLKKPSSYELYNSHQFLKTVVLLFSKPSFIRIVS